LEALGLDLLVTTKIKRFRQRLRGLILLKLTRFSLAKKILTPVISHLLQKAKNYRIETQLGFREGSLKLYKKRSFSAKELLITGIGYQMITAAKTRKPI